MKSNNHSSPYIIPKIFIHIIFDQFPSKTFSVSNLTFPLIQFEVGVRPSFHSKEDHKSKYTSYNEDVQIIVKALTST